METLPREIIKLIREFQTDGIHPTAKMIKRLKFIPNSPMNGGSIIIMTEGDQYFHKRTLGGWMRHKISRTYFYSDFDERIHPHHFGIHLTWTNMVLQDQIEAYLDTVVTRNVL